MYEINGKTLLKSEIVKEISQNDRKTVTMVIERVWKRQADLYVKLWNFEYSRDFQNQQDGKERIKENNWKKLNPFLYFFLGNQSVRCSFVVESDGNRQNSAHTASRSSYGLGKGRKIVACSAVL